MDALSQLFCLLGLALPVQSEIAPPALGREGVVLVAAHRGGYSNDKVDNAPENSVANVKLAIRKGFDVFETDIQRTADGVFVIVHDSTLDRETNGSGPVKNLTLKQLKALRKRYRDGSLSEERVATLEELLLAGRGKILFKPDLKPGIIDHFTELAQLITRLKMADQVFLRTGFGDAWEIKSCFENGCPRVEVMFKTKSLAQVKSVIERFSPRTIQVDIAKGEVVSPDKADAIREAVRSGVVVQTHCYGDPKQWQQLAELGVRMFHTGAPKKTLQFLKDNGWRKGE